MRNIIDMYRFLIDNLTSHTLDLTGNTIIAKRKYNSRSFASFKITYLKNNTISYKSTSYNSRTLNFINDDDLICQLGAVAAFR